VDARKDYYQILGVDENASQAEIKKAYRKLAKEYHPDKHQGDKRAEDRFKEISDAYSVLNNEKKRKEYNTIRNSPFGGDGGFNFQGVRPGGFHFESSGGFDDISNIFSNLFGGSNKGGRSSFGSGINFEDFAYNRQRQSPVQGRDIEAEITIGFEMAANGGETILNTGRGKKVKIKIPPGIENGKRIKIKGQGENPGGGALPGNFYVKINVAPHPEFERKSNDIYSIAKINMAEALLGTEIYVKTIKGKKVKLKIPPRTSSGKTFRLPGMGIVSKSGKGDHNVKVMVVVPENLTSSQIKKFKEWAAETGLIS
jgi:DnaJ-class molecular chaperone